MNEDKTLNKLLLAIGEIVPTVFFIGTTKDKRGAMFMGSPEEDSEKRAIDVASSVAMMMGSRQDARDILMSAVCYYLEKNPEDQAKMYTALSSMKKAKAQS